MLFARNASALPARGPTAAGLELYGRFFLETRAAARQRSTIPFRSRNAPLHLKMTQFGRCEASNHS
jgi:hypothetical protein